LKFLVYLCLAFVLRAEECGGVLQRLIVGAEGSGGAATHPTGRVFTDIFIETPLCGKRSGFSVWVDARTSSVPQQFDIKVTAFNPIASFNQLKVNQIAQAFEILGGASLRIFGQREAHAMPLDPYRSRTTVSLIAAYGGVTPFVPAEFVDAFAMPPKDSDAYDRLRAVFGAQLDRRPGATVVAFIPADHQRFRSQYYGGIRMQSHYYSDGKTEALPPRTVDILFGQNEIVTGDRLAGAVFRMDWFQPVAKAGWVTFYIFGTAIQKLGRSSDASRDALVLARTAGPVDLTSTSTLLLTAPSGTRDFFRFGVGVDFSFAARK
jgi:hypothetical protein